MSPYTKIPCNLCGADDAVPLERRARWGEQMHNVICRRCGLVYASPRLDRETLDEFYRRRVYPQFLGADGRFTDRLINAATAEAAVTFRYFANGLELRDRSVLEIGCGLGHFLALCRDAGARVQGVELDGLYADYAEREHGLPIIRKHIEHVQFEHPFDVIAMFHVVEHLEDPVALLAEARRLLAPDGRLLIEVPNLTGPWRVPPAEFFRVEHLFNFTFETLSQMLRRAGFAVEAHAHNHDPYLVRVVARAAEAASSPDLAALAGERDRVERHLFKWRWRARLFQPWYAGRRWLRGASRPAPPP